MVQTESIVDSLFPPPAGVLRRTTHFRVLRHLLGQGPVRGSFTDQIAKGVPRPARGDTLLVLWQLDVGANADTSRWTQVISLSHRGTVRSDRGLDTHFGVFHSPDSVLATVERRVRMIRAGRPLGDARAWRFADFVRGRGSLAYWMPEASEAQRATYAGSINQLVVPADADRLASVLRETHARRAEERATAAWRLAAYPGPRAIARLREMLKDDAAVALREDGRAKAVHAVRAQAYRVLVGMSVAAPRPPGFAADSTLLPMFEN